MDNLEAKTTTPAPKAPKPVEEKLPAFQISNTSCCGLQEVYGFHGASAVDPRLFFKGIGKSYTTQYERYNVMYRRYHDTPNAGRGGLGYSESDMYKIGTKIAGCLVFTMTVGFEGYVANFKEFAEKNGLGVITVSDGWYNPNSSRTVHTMLWMVDNTGYLKFIQKEFPNKEG